MREAITPERQIAAGHVPAAEARAFIIRHTTVAAPPACPEISLRLAPDLIALWEAMETTFGGVRPTPFWAHAWVGGQALARYLLDTPAVVAGRRILDFGAGGGVVAIAAGKAGAATVTACDIDPMARAAVPLNAELNRVPVEVVADELLGRELESDLVVLAGDVWYERHLAERATLWLRRLAAGGHTVLVGDKRRAFFPKSGLEPLAMFELATSTDVEPDTSSPAGVWRVQP
ncbi:MAG: methyltransferase [Rhodospirillales bacterium]|nr:methyltransferase [Rhodospirillales bacterium]